MGELKNFLFPKIDFKRDIIRVKIWFPCGKRFLSNNMTGQADVTLCKSGAVDGLLNKCIRRYFFPLEPKKQRSKKKKGKK